MSTSAKTYNHRVILKRGYTYLIWSIVCAVIGGVYELFSHDVYSYYMLYAFMIPLILGAVPLFTVLVTGIKYTPDRISHNLYGSGVATLTVGSLFQGVLKIYGTTNGLIYVYLVVGLILCGLGTLYHILMFKHEVTKTLPPL